MSLVAIALHHARTTRGQAEIARACSASVGPFLVSRRAGQGWDVWASDVAASGVAAAVNAAVAEGHRVSVFDATGAEIWPVR